MREDAYKSVRSRRSLSIGGTGLRSVNSSWSSSCFWWNLFQAGCLSYGLEIAGMKGDQERTAAAMTALREAVGIVAGIMGAEQASAAGGAAAAAAAGAVAAALLAVALTAVAACEVHHPSAQSLLIHQKTLVQGGIFSCIFPTIAASRRCTHSPTKGDGPGQAIRCHFY